MNIIEAIRHVTEEVYGITTGSTIARIDEIDIGELLVAEGVMGKALAEGDIIEKAYYILAEDDDGDLPENISRFITNVEYCISND